MTNPSTMRRALGIAVAVAFTFGAFAAGRFVPGFAHAASAAPESVQVAAPVQGAASAPPPAGAVAGAIVLPDFADLVARQGAAVVQIKVVAGMKRTANRGRRGPEGPDDDPFAPFRRDFPFPFPDAPQPGPSQGQGSGFIVSADGVILTNAHVVDGAEEVAVTLNDKREFPAKVIGKDRTTDVAVLRIDATNLPTVTIGDPERARVGEWVLAIGAPYGLDNTVTSGIISAKGRSLPGDSYVPFIQTDAAVNPGNSGGPLFNLKGEVIGINSQIFSRTGGFQGLAFAIPIDVAMNVKDQIMASGKVAHGRIGVTVQPVDQGLSESFGLARAEGALVGAVQKDSPAAKAGVEAGDIILKFDGKPVSRSSDLPPMVASSKPGRAVTLTLWRNKSARDVTVTLGTLDDPEKVADAQSPEPPGKLGVAVRPLSPDEKRGPDGGRGVVVEDVSGPAARAGIRPGDVILSVNRTPVDSPAQLRDLVSASGKVAALLIRRGDSQLFVPVRIG